MASLAELCSKFHDIYLQFITRLVEVYPGSENAKKVLQQNISLVASLDFQTRVVQQCNRWRLMVDANPDAFRAEEDAYLLVAQPLGLFADIEINKLVEDRDTFRLFRVAFWKFVKKLTETADKILAIAPKMNTANLEQEAKIAATLEELGMATVITPDGRFGPDMSKLVDPNNTEVTMRNLQDIIRRSGIDTNKINRVMAEMGVESPFSK